MVLGAITALLLAAGGPAAADCVPIANGTRVLSAHPGARVLALVGSAHAGSFTAAKPAP